MSDLRIEAMEYKVYPGTQAKTFHDAFFQAQDVVVNALDSVEARRYVDRLVCVYVSVCVCVCVWVYRNMG